ncbi:MAG: YceD family protein [Sphingomicrobium sp.]
MIEDFAHRLTLDRIRDGDRIDLIAEDDERRAIAERLDLASLHRLEAHASLARDGATIRASGRVAASLEQCCVVTGEPVAAHVDEAFEITFVPEPRAEEEEVELRPEDCDVVFHDGTAIDLGTAIADTLALSLDPYPRSASAEAALREAGVLSEEEASPFAVLARLRKDLGGNDA